MEVWTPRKCYTGQTTTSKHGKTLLSQGQQLCFHGLGHKNWMQRVGQCRQLLNGFCTNSKEQTNSI